MLKKKLTAQIYLALEEAIVKGTGRLPFVKPDVSEIVARVNTLTHHRLELREPRDFFDPRIQIEVLDWVAKEHTRKAQMLALTSGAGSSTIGLAGLAIDMPVLIATTVGLVRRHALIYGFTEIEDSKGDAMPLLLALGGALGAEITIGQLTPRLARWVGVDMGTRLVERYLLKRISERLAGEIVVHWLPRAVPLLGMAASAALDYAFLRVAGDRSLKHYRAQHQLVRRQLGDDRSTLDQLLAGRRRVPPADDEIIDAEFVLKSEAD